MATKDKKSGYMPAPTSEYDPMTANVICPSCGWEGPIWNKKTGRIHMYCPKCDFGNLKPTETDHQLDEPMKKESKFKSFGDLIQEQDAQKYNCSTCKISATKTGATEPPKCPKCQKPMTLDMDAKLNEGEYEMEEDAIGVVDDLSKTIDDVRYSAVRAKEIVEKLQNQLIKDELGDRVDAFIKKASNPGGQSIVGNDAAGTIERAFNQLITSAAASYTAIITIINVIENAKEPGEVE